MRRGRYLGLLLAGALLLVAGCSSGGSGAGSDPGHGHGPKVTVQVRAIPGVGKVLVTARGYALYMFEPDNQRSVTCTGACAGSWPPVKVPGSYAAGPGVDGKLLGTDPDPEGGRVLTYNGWPLYTYTGDVQPAQATGQAIDLNGGEWYVIRPDGKPLIPIP